MSLPTMSCIWQVSAKALVGFAAIQVMLVVALLLVTCILRREAEHMIRKCYNIALRRFLFIDLTPWLQSLTFGSRFLPTLTAKFALCIERCSPWRSEVIDLVPSLVTILVKVVTQEN